jgi:hypothetical protein
MNEGRTGKYSTCSFTNTKKKKKKSYMYCPNMPAIMVGFLIPTAPFVFRIRQRNQRREQSSASSTHQTLTWRQRQATPACSFAIGRPSPIYDPNMAPLRSRQERGLCSVPHYWPLCPADRALQILNHADGAVSISIWWNTPRMRLYMQSQPTDETHNPNIFFPCKYQHSS